MYDHEHDLSSNWLTERYLPIARFKRKMDVSDEDWFDSLPNALTELRKGRRDMLRAVVEAADSQEHYSYAIATHDAGTPPVPPLPASSPLGSTVDDFIAEHARQWAAKTTNQNRAYLNILVEWFGPDRLLSTITKQDASEVKKVLQALPSNRNTKPALKDLPLADVIKLTGYPTISPKTINSHIQMFSSFFDWAERHGHTSNKLFNGMKVAKAKNAATERKPFSPHLTRLIFTELTENPSRIVRKESHKWGALLGMFTGARLNEICQLEIADIKQEDGVWFLNITDEGDNNKTVKAKASRRKVPVHSELIRLGLLEFVDSRRHAQRLFPDFSYSTNGGYGRNLGRWYNDTFLPKLGIKEPALVFHSLRHTMVTRLAQAGVAEPIYQCLVGHARDGVTQEVYMREGFTLRQLSEAIEKFAV
ncbi:MAG: site-specific integrase [Rhodobacterales bacterium]